MITHEREILNQGFTYSDVEITKNVLLYFMFLINQTYMGDDIPMGDEDIQKHVSYVCAKMQKDLQPYNITIHHKLVKFLKETAVQHFYNLRTDVAFLKFKHYLEEVFTFQMPIKVDVVFLKSALHCVCGDQLGGINSRLHKHNGGEIRDIPNKKK